MTSITRLPHGGNSMFSIKRIQHAFKAAEKPKYFKSADVNNGAGEHGLHTKEVFQRRSSPFHIGTRVTRDTYSDPMGHRPYTTRGGETAHLTPLGRKTRNVAAVTGGVGLYGGLAVHGNRKHTSNRKVEKNMTTVSIWGVNHGEEIAKAWATDPKTGKKPSTGRKVAGTLTGGWHPIFAGRKGKKLRATGNVVVGGVGGSLAGSALGAAVTRGRTSGAMAGQMLGAWGGSAAGTNRNQKKGYLKPQS